MKKCNLEMMAKYADFANLALRLPMAAIFIAHGMMKWSLWTAATPMPGAMGIIMKILSIAEPLAGLALIAGLLTRWASIGLIIDMIGAIYVKYFNFHGTFIGQKSTGWEFDLMLLGAAVALLILGAGKYSLDEMWCKKHMQSATSQPAA